ncbi:hypothetical protein TTHERM_01260680 (macronuclear) [Tetrahymena thermophila SB210]|uniref:Transposase Tc1-like domain-containing protein n=1 Tax=Tetrahymena thermophila (strain SB210) TaxID=312017 RepID=Q22AA6_TETTS|nr:hypothetical protein TTHERM_01260680 [Tetrahymena thermophila SB210]EAR82213.2 hypothetical protein TTHERM_01260680 [Tetrahymena thermophila SB210]|eukprot:XP_001029876.2 hypothetical protein TTHERM_01260680 [Tetrahymena thermophila SB210]
MIMKGFKDNLHLSKSRCQKDKIINPNEMGVGKIRNLIQSSGLNTDRIPKVLLMTEGQKQLRLKFAKEKVRWSQKWRRVLFSDEIILKKGLIGKKYVWQVHHSDILQSQCYQKEKYPTKF